MNFDNTGGAAPQPDDVAGTITIHPNATASGSGFTQDYTQVGKTYFSVSWTQTTGMIGNKTCPNAACSGAFQGETVSGVASNVQQATYMADPLGSVPMVGNSTSLPTTSYPAGGQTGAFTISFVHNAVDKEHVVLIRDSVQSSGNGPSRSGAAGRTAAQPRSGTRSSTAARSR